MYISPDYIFYLKSLLGASLAVYWLRLPASTHGAGIQSMVGKQRSCMPCGIAKKRKKERKKLIKDLLSSTCNPSLAILGHLFSLLVWPQIDKHPYFSPISLLLGFKWSKETFCSNKGKVQVSFFWSGTWFESALPSCLVTTMLRIMLIMSCLLVWLQIV